MRPPRAAALRQIADCAGRNATFRDATAMGIVSNFARSKPRKAWGLSRLESAPPAQRQGSEPVKIKSQRDFWSGLMFVVLGIAFAWSATNYSFGSSARPGPGYFPFGLGLLLAALGSVVLFKALTLETPDGDPVGAFAWKPLSTIVGTVALFGWALPHLGLVVALPILVVVAALAGDEFHAGEALVNAAILTAGSWVIFIWGLKLTIPLWPSFIAG
jgi:hypothetical protein